MQPVGTNIFAIELLRWLAWLLSDGLMETIANPIRPTDLAEKLAISVPYASQLLSGARVPSIKLSLEIFDKANVKLGPMKDLSTAEIKLARKMTG